MENLEANFSLLSKFSMFLFQGEIDEEIIRSTKFEIKIHIYIYEKRRWMTHFLFVSFFTMYPRSGNINFPNCNDGENKNVVMLIHGRADFYLTCNSNESHGNGETCKCWRSLTYFPAIKGHVYFFRFLTFVFNTLRDPTIIPNRFFTFFLM